MLELPPFIAPFHVPDAYRVLPDMARLEGKHFQFDAQFYAYLERKLELLNMQPPGGWRSSTDKVGLERALWTVLEKVGLEWPQYVQTDAEGVTHQLLGLRLTRAGTLEHADSSAVSERILEMLEHRTLLEKVADFLGLSVQEDLVLLHGDKSEWLHVLFPSSWRPANKVGLSFAEIHRPVVHSEKLLKAAPNVVKAMHGRGPFERHVWLMAVGADQSQHPDLEKPNLEKPDLEPLIHNTFLRFERQTTLGLPASWAERHLSGLPALERSLFTIRVTMQPLTDLENDSDKRQKLARVLRSMDSTALEYRGYTNYREAWLEWLEKGVSV